MISAWPAALLGGLAGSGSGLAGVAVAGWPGAGILARAGVVYRLYSCAPVIGLYYRWAAGCIAVAERLIDYPLMCDNRPSRTMLPGVGRDSPLTNWPK